MIGQDEFRSAATSAGQWACLSGRQVPLVEVLDRVLNKGVVVVGEIRISVADIPLLYVGLNLIVTSVEKMAGEIINGG